MEDILRRWNIFAVLATSRCTCIGGFLILPPVAEAEHSLSNFGIFLVTLLIVLWSIPITIWRSRSFLKTWLALSLVLFFTSIAGYFFYQQCMTAWTFTYPPPGYSLNSAPTKQEIAGITFSQRAEDEERILIAAGKPHGPGDLVLQTGGSFVGVWPKTEEREYRLDILLKIYFGLLLISASAVVCAVQATFCLHQDQPATAA